MKTINKRRLMVGAGSPDSFLHNLNTGKPAPIVDDIMKTRNKRRLMVGASSPGSFLYNLNTGKPALINDIMK
ncbi:MAG: hypothetical protein ACRCT1_11280 [Microcoleaceae cyanobacterium]